MTTEPRLDEFMAEGEEVERAEEVKPVCVTLETLPQEWKDHINKYLASCPEPLTGMFIHAFTDGGRAAISVGKLKLGYLEESLADVLSDVRKTRDEAIKNFIKETSSDIQG